MITGMFFRLGSRIELGVKTDKNVCKHCFCCFYCFGSRILKLQRSKQMGSNEYGNIDLCL